MTMRKNIIGVLLLISLTALPGVLVAAAAAGDVAVVVSAKNPMTDLNSAEVRKIFAGERRSWPTGLRIKLFVRAPGTPERIALLKLLRMTEREYKQYWTAQVFRGEAQAEPVVLFSNDLQREALKIFPGAIVLVNAQDVKSDMKVIKVDGRMPGDADYPLR
jgi:hypothetical protein